MLLFVFEPIALLHTYLWYSIASEGTSESGWAPSIDESSEDECELSMGEECSSDRDSMVSITEANALLDADSEAMSDAGESE